MTLEGSMKAFNRIFSISLIASAMASTGLVHATELAKVNGKAISDKDLQNALSGLNEGQRANVLKDVNSRRQILSSVIDQELLVQEAEKEKLDQDANYKDALNA